MSPALYSCANSTGVEVVWCIDFDASVRVVYHSVRIYIKENIHMQVVLRTIIIGYAIFLVWNFDVIVFLLTYPINATIAKTLYATKPHKKVKISGVAYGYMIHRGFHRVTLDSPSLYGEMTLSITPFTKMIGLKDITYGTQVMVYGRVRVVLGQVCLVPTSIVCCNDEKKIKSSMRKRLSLCIWISIIMEVIYYVILLW